MCREKQRIANPLLIVSVILMLLVSGCQRHNPYQWQGYIEGQYTYLSSNTDGYLQQLRVVRGTPVQAGQVMFVLESQPQASQLQQAQDKLRQAQHDLSNQVKGQRYTILKGIQEQIRQASANLELNRITYERNKKLLATNDIAKQTFDQAEANFKTANGRFNELMANLSEAELGARTDVIASAQAAVAAAVEETNVAEWYLAKKTAMAPAAGSTYDTYFRVGEFVPAGRPVISMLVPRDIKVIFYVSEPMLGQIKLGDEVIVHCDGCKKNDIARISFISSQAEYTPPVIYSEQERKKFVYRVEALFNAKMAIYLHPGQPVDVSLKRN